MRYVLDICERVTNLTETDLEEIKIALIAHSIVTCRDSRQTDWRRSRRERDMMDEEIRQALSEVREMKKMCGNINMKLTNIVTQRGQDWKAKLEAEYQRGLEDAWECAKKLFSSMADSDIEKAFPIEWNNGGFKALMNLQPKEAIEKLKAYEEKQKTDDKIEVGDEVRRKSAPENERGGIVTKVWENSYFIMWTDGSSGRWDKDKVVKTGRHFDIASILKEMQS